MNYKLLLENINLSVRLGYSKEERDIPQQILLQITLQLKNDPLVCFTDNLKDTLCYASLIEDLQVFCHGQSFKLIEALGYQLYLFVKEKVTKVFSNEASIFLCITKNPPMARLSQASFSISD